MGRENDKVIKNVRGESLIKRIESRNDLHTLEYAQEVGLGGCNYEIKNVDN